MSRANFASEGIVLARKNYSEADKILRVLSRKHGKISLLAKGVRRPKSRKRAYIEIFNRINFSAASSKGMNIITEVEIIDTFSDFKKNLKKVALAYFFVEIVDKVIREGEKNEEIYNILLSFLNKLRSNESLKKIRREFVLNTLVSLGFWPKEKPHSNPDELLEEVLEYPQNSMIVGKKLFS